MKRGGGGVFNNSTTTAATQKLGFINQGKKKVQRRERKKIPKRHFTLECALCTVYSTKGSIVFPE